MIAASSSFVHRPHTRLALRVFNRVGGWLRALHAPLGRLTEEVILRGAERQTGLSDWGEERFREPLRLLLACHQRSSLTPVGRIVMQKMFIHLAANRLRIQRDLRTYPDIRAGAIRRPLFVVGLPRTGTTLLQNLLSQDPACRPMMLWESSCPSPPPEPSERSTDPRIRRSERQLRALYWALPGFRAIHDLDPRGPDECMGLLLNTFVSPFFQGHIPEYRAWVYALPDEAWLPVYREYREQLQLLQYRVSGDHWVLKSPAHLYSLTPLLALFPDACVVQTHRNPLQAVPSLCSLTAVYHGLLFETIDRAQVGQQILQLVERLIDRSLKARQVAAPERFFDMSYADLVRDPVASVRRIYEHFGYDFSPAFEERLRTYQAANPQHKHGAHTYSLADFNLDPAALEERFGPYCERFGLTRREARAAQPSAS